MTKETQRLDEAVKLFDEETRAVGDYKSISLIATQKGIFPTVTYWLPVKHSENSRIDASLSLDYQIPSLITPSQVKACRTKVLQSSRSMRGLPEAIGQAIGKLYEPARLRKAKLEASVLLEESKQEEQFFEMIFDADSGIYTIKFDKRYRPDVIESTRLDIAGHHKDFLEASKIIVSMYNDKNLAKITESS